MFTVKRDTTLVGVSELRYGIEKLLKKTRKSHIIIEKRNKPLAVLMSNEEYEHISELLDTAEDIILGKIAEERFDKSREKDYLDIESLL